MPALVQHEPLINSQHIRSMRLPSIRLIGIAGWINVLIGLIALLGVFIKAIDGRLLEAVPLVLLSFCGLLFGLVTQAEHHAKSSLSLNKYVYVCGCLFSLLLAIFVGSGSDNTPFCLLFIGIAIVYGLHANRLSTGPNLSSKRTQPRGGWSAYFRR